MAEMNLTKDQSVLYGWTAHYKTNKCRVYDGIKLDSILCDPAESQGFGPVATEGPFTLQKKLGPDLLKSRYGPYIFAV